jgi:GntR family transcriptional regulator
VNHKIKIDPKSATPIWRQLEEVVRQLVGSGEWEPDEPVPSVRTLATDLLVNPATVAKAYQRLVDLGVLVVRRGDGTYVASHPPILARAERTRTLRDAAERYASVTAMLGAEPEEAVAALRQVFTSYVRVSAGAKK